jgi:hypothetical protein
MKNKKGIKVIKSLDYDIFSQFDFSDFIRNRKNAVILPDSINPLPQIPGLTCNPARLEKANFLCKNEKNGRIF